MESIITWSIFASGASWSSGLIRLPTAPRVGGSHPRLGNLSFFCLNISEEKSRRKVEQDGESVQGYVKMAGAAKEGGSGET